MLEGRRPVASTRTSLAAVDQSVRSARRALARSAAALACTAADGVARASAVEKRGAPLCFDAAAPAMACVCASTRVVWGCV